MAPAARPDNTAMNDPSEKREAAAILLNPASTK